MSAFGELVNLTDALVAGVSYAEMSSVVNESVAQPARATQRENSGASGAPALAVPEISIAEVSVPVGVGRWGRLLNVAADMFSRL